MKLEKVTLSEPTYDRYGNIILTLSVPRKFKKYIENFKETLCDVKITKHREKRSKNANDYLWVLCDKIADAVDLSKEEVYQDAIKHRGIYKDFHNLAPKDADTLKVVWNTYGTGWIAEQVDYEPDGETVIIRCYYGSSVYDTKQMSRLIDYIVNEAKNLDIETMTPDELLNMKSQWKGMNIC